MDDLVEFETCPHCGGAGEHWIMDYWGNEHFGGVCTPCKGSGAMKRDKY